MGDEVEKISGDYQFVGVIVSDFKKLSGARRLVVEDDRGVLHIYSEKNLRSLADHDGFSLQCYGKVYGTSGTFNEARLFQENHIHNCPEGPMPWAVDIAWNSVPGVGWVSASGGAWLNHAVLRSRVSSPLSQATIQFLLENENHPDAGEVPGKA